MLPPVNGLEALDQRCRREITQAYRKQWDGLLLTLQIGVDAPEWQV
jgi:hypothetical protein